MKKQLIALLILPFTMQAQTWVNIGSAGFSADTVITTSISIDGSGAPYVVYMDASVSYGATLKKYIGSSWITVCGSSEAGYISMAVDGTGIPYVVYTIPSFSSYRLS